MAVMQSANRRLWCWMLLIVAWATISAPIVGAQLRGQWDKGADRIINTDNYTAQDNELIFSPGKPHHALMVDHVPAVNTWSALTAFWPEVVTLLLVVSPIIVFFILRRRHVRLSTRHFCKRCRYEMPPPPAAVPAVCSECGADLTRPRSLCRGEPMTLAAWLVAISILAFGLGFFTFLRQQSRLVPFKDAFNWPSVWLYEQATKRQWEPVLLDTRYVPLIREVDLSDGTTVHAFGPYPFEVARIQLSADQQNLLVYDDGGASGLPQIRRTVSIVKEALSEQSRSAAMASSGSSEIVSDESASTVVLRALQDRGVDLAVYENPVLKAAVISRNGTRAFFANEAYVYSLDLSDPLSRPDAIEGSHRWGYESLTLSADGKRLIAVSFGRMHNGGAFTGPPTPTLHDSLAFIDPAQDRVIETRVIEVPGVGVPARFSPDGKHLVVPFNWGTGAIVIDLDTVGASADQQP